MLLERGVTMGVELSEELLLVQGRHRAVTACRTGNNVKGVVAVAFEVTVDGIDVNGEVLSGFFRCGALLDQGDDASTKFQPIPSNSRCIHTSIMSNALNVNGKEDRLGSLKFRLPVALPLAKPALRRFGSFVALWLES